METLFALLVDGPLEGQLVAVFEDQSFIDAASVDSLEIVRYEIKRYVLLGKVYLIGAVDIASANSNDLPTKIKAANHHPYLEVPHATPPTIP